EVNTPLTGAETMHMIAAMKIKVLLVDDHKIVRQGLCALLSAQEDMEVVGEAETGRKAIAAAEQCHPDVIVMDIAMPNLNGIETARQLLRKKENLKILVLSSYSDSEYVRGVLEAGAIGFLVKQSAASELVNAIREIWKGNS